MADNGIGDYFISDIDDEMLEEEDELISAPVVVPGSAQQAQPTQSPAGQSTPPSASQTAPVAAGGHTRFSTRVRLCQRRRARKPP